MVDVGSNSVLLLVAEKVDGAWKPLLETSEVTALGEGTRSTGLLGEKGMAATLAAISRAFARAIELNADNVVAAVTMAGRIAKNTPDFIERARAQGTPVEVISGDREAELGLAAVLNDPAFAAVDRLSVIDVGGQSTEIVVAEPAVKTPIFARSFAIGTLALRETVLSAENPPPQALLAASVQIDEVLGDATFPESAGEAVTLGATGTNLISIRDRIEPWDPARVHGATLDLEEVSRAVGWLSSMTDAERAALVGIEKGREKTIHIGALILERALNALHKESCRVSVRGWRYGLLD